MPQIVEIRLRYRRKCVNPATFSAFLRCAALTPRSQPDEQLHNTGIATLRRVVPAADSAPWRSLDEAKHLRGLAAQRRQHAAVLEAELAQVRHDHEEAGEEAGVGRVADRQRRLQRGGEPLLQRRDDVARLHARPICARRTDAAQNATRTRKIKR